VAELRRERPAHNRFFQRGKNLEETIMMTRRNLFLAAAAGAAMLSRPTNLFAATYDLIIKGGHVIDPSLRINEVRDIAISGGRIAAVEANIAGDATETIDARGKYVTPGLIDIHTHAGRGGAALALSDGVTAWVDAGSFGADGIDQAVTNAASLPNLGRLLINISRTGVAPGGELHDLSRADVGLARGAIGRHRDFIIGVKARLSNNVAGANDLEALRRAQAAAEPFGLPVMIHVGQNYSPMRSILSLLRRGDIVTHMYAPPPNSILDDQGRLFPDVTAARRRGVIFDFGNGGGGHFNWDMVERATRQGFWPDTLSTDWNAMSRSNPGVIDFPNIMSKFLMFGMPLDQVIACATVNAARAFEAFNDRGTLNVGAPADVAVLELRDGSFEFIDNYNNKRNGTQRLFPVAAVLGGKRSPSRA
jgi:dihydroorotase